MLNFCRSGKIITIDSGRFVIVSDINNIIIDDSYLPYHDVIYIPCIHIDSDYTESIATFAISSETKKVTIILYSGHIMITGWIRINGSYLARN